jgi:23S rRNA (guanosine2251-2'-O)-methyltransferase
LAKEWITGRNPVYEVIRAQRRDIFRLLVAKGTDDKGRLSEIIQLAPLHRLKVEYVPRQQLDSLLGGGSDENHQGVALEVSAYPYSTLYDIQELAKERAEPLFVLVLDVIQNPQNLGTLLRTAEAVGVHGVLLPLARAAGVTPAVVHASAGSTEHLLVATANLAQSLQALKDAGAWVTGLEGSPQAQPVEQVRLDGPLALVVGSEGEGMRELVRRHCDTLVHLPMLGQVASLNAAVAGSVILYMALQQRLKKP